MQPTLIGEPVNQRESAELTAVLYDDDGAELDKAALQKLEVTQTLAFTGIVINNRENQNILDANNGSVAEDGTLTLLLQPLDTVVLASAPGGVEVHHLYIEWQWINNDGDPMTGSHWYKYRVLARDRKDHAPYLPANMGWVG